jgi:hypothetical protein
MNHVDTKCKFSPIEVLNAHRHALSRNGAVSALCKGVQFFRWESCRLADDLASFNARLALTRYLAAG